MRSDYIVIGMAPKYPEKVLLAPKLNPRWHSQRELVHFLSKPQPYSYLRDTKPPQNHQVKSPSLPI